MTCMIQGLEGLEDTDEALSHQEASLVEAHLHKLEEHGFLNYFGTQRCGQTPSHSKPRLTRPMFGGASSPSPGKPQGPRPMG